MNDDLSGKANPKRQKDQGKKDRSKKKIMVLGVGNLILSDEGFGIHVFQELEKKKEELNIPSNVELMDGGTLGLDLLHYVEGIDKLIVVDVIDAGVDPGSIFRFKPADIETQQVRKLSLHQITLFDALSMAEKTEVLPKEIIIIAIQPKELSWGMELTEEIKSKMPKVIDLVMEEIDKA